MESCRIQTCITFPTNLYNKYPNSIASLNLRNSNSKFRCCSWLWRSSWSRFTADLSYIPLTRLEELNSGNCSDFGREFIPAFSRCLITPQYLSLSVVVRDENWNLGKMLGELNVKSLKMSNEGDVHLRANVVLDEVVPLLLKNADRWLSNRFFVTSNEKESLLKRAESDRMITNKIYLERADENWKLKAATMSNLMTVRCTEVTVDVSIIGVIDAKFKDIHTHEDLKALLHHLMSMDGVERAISKCTRLLYRCEDHSDATT